MAKVNVIGDAVIITSACKYEDIEKVRKYRPAEAVLKDEDKVPYFGISVSKGTGSISDAGVSFNGATRDEQKLATLTIGAKIPEGASIKEWVADTYGAILVNLGKLERVIPEIVRAIDEEKANVMAQITIQ